MRKIAFVVLLLLTGCKTIFGLEVGECVFYVTRKEPAVITWDDFQRCVDTPIQLYSVEFVSP